MERQDYPAIVGHVPPSQATAILSERIRVISKVNTDIADWLLERRRLEEQYTQGLRKLARRPQQDGGSALGIFQAPWKRIITATESLAQSHETLAQEIEADVERPLREYATKNREMQSMSTIQHDLANLAKELEMAQKKADKLREKGPKSGNKMSQAISASQDVNQQWESRAPYVFEQLQAIDEHRLNQLRDVLTQFETHEVDQIERNRQAAESCLNALLNVQTADEIKTFAARVTGGRATEPQEARREDQSSPVPAPAAPPLEPLAPPPKIQDDAASQRSGRSTQGRPSGGPEPRPEPRHKPLGGLRRLGTVMGRRKSVIIPNDAGPSSPERKFRSPFASFRRADSSRSFQAMDNQGNSGAPLEPVPSREEPSSLRRSPSGQSAPRDTSIFEPQPQQRPFTPNGAAIPESIAESPPALPSTTAEHPAAPPAPQTDSEGYSKRPDSIDEISRIQKEAAASEEPGLNLTIRDQPIKEDEGEATMALNEMANTLRKKAQQTGISRGTGTLRGRRDVRNTMFIPNPPPPGEEITRISPMPSPAPAQSPSPSQQPPKTVAAVAGSHEDHTIPDNTSVHSSQTLHSLSGPISHPELSEPGLNASIVETVNAWFSEGAVTRSFVVGELALAYNATSEQMSNDQLVYLDNFHVLEKVAANPSFVTEAKNTSSVKGKEKATDDDDKKGQYVVSLPSISRSTPAVAFKYQVHLDNADPSLYCPVIFTPAWNMEEFQASVIIAYSLNPKFVSFSPSTSIILRNVVLTVNLDLSPEDEVTKQPREVARATGALMHPNTGASFRRKVSAVTWKLPELEVTPGQDGKFLARFTTATSWPRKGKVEAKFEIRDAGSNLRLGISAHVPEPAEQGQKDVDPFADETLGGAPSSSSTALRTWKGISTQRRLGTGRYISY